MKKIIIGIMCLMICAIVIPITHAQGSHELEIISRGNFNFFWSNQSGVLDMKIASSTEETYHPNDRKWNGLPSITVTPGGRLWAVWMTGGMLEPDKHNYNVMYYSDDGGDTWSEEFLILEAADESKQIYTPNLFIDQDGLMWYYINYGGTHGIIITNPDCDNPSKELELSPSVISLTPNPLAHIPTILSEDKGGIWLAPLESTQHLLTQRIFVSTNKILWEPFSSLITGSPSIKRFNESQIVELNDGRLMILSRLDGGSGIERAYSSDNGATWSNFETDLSEPYIGPGSKFEIRRLNSGSILLINHNSTTSREKITAYLSLDDGETWPHKLVLDERILNGGYWGVSYPNFTQDSNGTIYVVWDQRTPLVEINFARFTENDMISGQLAENSIRFKNIVRNSDYVDIQSVDGIEKYEYRFEVGVSSNEIMHQLPTILTIKNTHNESITVEGEFMMNDFDSSQPGVFKANFMSSQLPDKWIDSHGLLQITIKIEDKNIDNNLLWLFLGIGIVVLSGIACIRVYKTIQRKKGIK